ncbi:Glycoside hydrolase, family 32 [Corchorus olitorius]|uniref:Glycoside hydrolase, family 32 n=1 Tax=Corchorus olitorius TaxID=93759 RepID=A0A1R3IVF1_9ROSI|nr:Glycoside hydrolase, family 32 [Corchorus olitorius]
MVDIDYTDPNGPMYYKGVYHLFYQYNPNGALFGETGMVWGHSASYDLVNWFGLENALVPSDPFDKVSCWSGSATILPGNKPVILYTGIDSNNNQVQNLATPKNLSDPLLREWVKYSGNSLMTPPEGVTGDNFRDPTTGWQGPDGTWRVIVGGWSNNQGMAILYESEDFVHWKKSQDPLYASAKTGMWECPDFFPVSINSSNGLDTSVMNNPGVRHVMKASFMEDWHDYYTVGNYDTEQQKFVPHADFTGTNQDLRFDYGKLYASKTFFDSKKDRRILWGWVNESDSTEDVLEKGWSGLQIVPRKIWLDGTGKQLLQWPVEEINTLRDNQVNVYDKKLESGSIFEVSGITASQADIEIMFELPQLEEAEFLNTNLVDPQLICDKEDASVNGGFGPFGVLALATKDLTEQTAIFFRVFRGEKGYVVLMCSDQKRSSLRNGLDKTTYGAFVDIDPSQEMISLRTLIDHSIIESFGGNGKSCITTRVYPKLAINNEAHLYVLLPAEDQQQPYRTGYHFQPPQNWMNDPNGPLYYKGVYHLFYQYNPNGALFGDTGMVWAHSVSYDLVNWFSLDHALIPSEPFDKVSCWSGSATILQGNKPVILYTGIDAENRQVQNLATPKNLSDPLLREWVKYSANPLMTPPDGVEKDNFRDPTTAWKDTDGTWRVIIGSWSNNLGMAMLYQSEDFVHWTKYQDPLYESGTAGMWECPDFFPVSINSTNGVDNFVPNSTVRHVMKASFAVNAHDYYIVGTYDTKLQKFLPDADFTGTSLDLRIDYGKFYASKTFFDSNKNRRILWGWVNESDSTEDDLEKGWSGLQSVPRKIWLDRTGKQLVQWPVEELNTLRDNQVDFYDKQLESGLMFEVSGITASQADIEIMFELPQLEEAEFLNTNLVDPQLICDKEDASVNGGFGPFGILALATKDLTERTAIFFRVFRGVKGYVVLMCSDQKRSSLRNGLDKTTYGAFVDIDPQQEMISLRSLIDHSIIESYGGNGKSCITTRVYPELAINNEAHLYVFNNGTKSVTISRLNAWSMNKARINCRGVQADNGMPLSTEQPYRTAYHFQPPKNWMNGPMYLNGVYHLFYQYNPYAAIWGNMTWGHSVSYDLINWIHLQHALSPVDPYDFNGVYSGSTTFISKGKPAILYTGVDTQNRQAQCLALPKNISDPFLKEWVKSPHNPLMKPINDIDPQFFRDPTTAWKGPDGLWRVLVGNQMNGHGTALLYRSKDFVTWSRSKVPLHSSNKTVMWECPDFYPVAINGKDGVETSSLDKSNKHVLKASFNQRDYYVLGKYKAQGDKFSVDKDFTNTKSDLSYDYGKFYASKTFFDSNKKRRVLWGWVNESDSQADDIKKGWSSVQSIPRTILLSKDGKQLIQWPIKEIEKLRTKKVSFNNKKLKGGSVLQVSGITASQADVSISFDLPNLKDAEVMNPSWVDPQLLCSSKKASVRGKAGPFGLLVLASKGLAEQTAVFFRVFKNHDKFVVLMCSDQSRSSLTDQGLDKTTYGAFINIDPSHEKISLRTLIDRSIVESFGGEGKACITARVYPKLAIDKEAYLYAFNNGTMDVTISSLKAWSLKKAQLVSATH